jgi:hypothetical protein
LLFPPIKMTALVCSLLAILSEEIPWIVPDSRSELAFWTS